MSGAQHTPGPWTVSDHYIEGPDVERTMIATMLWPRLQDLKRRIDLTEEHRCNLRLIAAAPDLLAALKLLAEDVKSYPALDRPCHALNEALAAIAKAEGR